MAWDIEFTDEFGDWWDSLTEAEHTSITAAVQLLESRGSQLPYPYSSGINNSKHSHMRELRIQHQGKPYRVLYAFDPRRTGILLVGGDKTGNNRWYDIFIPIADNLYDKHLNELKEEGEI